jgi:uncharacterized damage-inducible protein DinB
MEELNTTLAVEFREQAAVRMQESLDKIRGCLDVLDDRAFWHRPNKNSNGAAQLLRHLQGNIGQYILSGLGGAPDHRDRPSEFEAVSPGERETVEAGFFEVARAAVEQVRSMPDADLLNRQRVQGFDLSGMGIVVHVVEHLSSHTGQLVYLTKLLCDVDLGFYRDFDLNQKNE